MRLFKLLLGIVAISIQRELAHRANLLFEALLALFSAAAGLLALRIVYTQAELLAGWRLEEAIVLLGMYFAGEPVIVLAMDDAGVPGFEVVVGTSQRDAFEQACAAAGAAAIPPETGEALRIEAGIPLFHRDMDEETIPLEAGIESRAISLTKGCYVGQEVIIRVLHRGHGRVARRLVGLVLESDRAAEAGAVVTSEGREIGRVTSATLSPALGKAIALAYVHRDFTAPGTAVVVAAIPGMVSALPFVA